MLGIGRLECAVILTSHGQWRRRGVALRMEIINKSAKGNQGCVTVKGNPFWAGVYQEDDIWLTVDVRTEVIRVFSGPEYVKSAVTTTSIVALGDNAAQIVYSHGTELGDMIRVYALEENSGTWTLMYAIESMGLQMPVHLECYKDGRFVTKDRYGKLFTYDLASEEIKNLGVGEGMEAHYMTINYIESLVAIAGMERVREGAAQEAGQAGQETGLSANDRDALDDMVLERIE